MILKISYDCLQFGKSKMHMILYNKYSLLNEMMVKCMYKEIERIIVESGRIMLEASGKIKSINEKTSASDVVTEYDVRIQDFIVSELKSIFPEAVFLGEEGNDSERCKFATNGCVFIIDPIDGTTNFVRNLQKSAVSIALCENGVVTYGCCYIPYCDELYTAIKGQGAYCNGSPIKCIERDIKRSLVSVGTSPYCKERFGEATFNIMLSLYKDSMDIRRMGSAVIDLLDVACGRVDLFFEMRLSPWDYAAAGLIVTEAGGVFTDMNGSIPGYDNKYSIVAGSKTCCDYFMHHPVVAKYNHLF